MIHEADRDWVWKKWPRERLYLYVEGRRIGPTSPGYDFVRAGWRRCGVTTGGLIALELLPGSEVKV